MSALRGFSPKVRMQIKLRAGIEGHSLDGGYVRCEKCGEYVRYSAAQIHHRLPRGSGSSKRPEVNTAANGLCLCAGPVSPNDCHGVIESDRAAAFKAGWLIPRGRNPQDVTVKLWDGWHLLFEDGSRIAVPAPDRGAA